MTRRSAQLPPAPANPDAARALRRALRWLRAGDKSEAELRQRLALAGFSSDAVGEATLWLKRSAMLNDARTAAGAFASAIAKGESGALAAEKLAARGLHVDNPADGDSQRAIDAARALAARARGVPPAKAWSRVLSGLARRGYTEEAALDAARAALGAPTDPAE